MISFKERVKTEAIKNACIYEKNFINYEYLVCSEAFERGYHIIKSDKGNYLHLIGIHTNLSAEEFLMEKEEKTEEKAVLVSGTEEESEVIKEQIMCPRCGAPMIKRIAKKGKNIGKEFWGCSNFPKCRGVISEM